MLGVNTISRYLEHNFVPTIHMTTQLSFQAPFFSFEKKIPTAQLIRVAGWWNARSCVLVICFTT